MSDGFHDSRGDFDGGRDTGLDLPFERLRSSPHPRGCEISRVLRFLPRIGSVLCVYREQHTCDDHRFHDCSAASTVDHPVFLALAACNSIRLESAVTSQGPREYLEFADVRDRVHAKLFLLPDTDYLAWDEMVAELCGTFPLRAEIPTWQAPSRYLRAALARLGGRWHAMPLCFVRAQPMLAASPARSLSAIGERVATLIANDERVQWSKGFG